MINNAPCVLPEKRVQLILWTLLMLSPIIGMAVDLIAPSLPGIVTALHAPASIVKDIVSIYILGYALGNFLTGFLTDAWGRQKLLRAALLLFIVISLMPVFFPRMDVLLFVRFMQGIALGSAAVLVRTTFSDIFPPEKLVHLGTLMGTMFGLGPVIGPVIGGYLQYYIGWKAGFCFFSLVTLVMLIAIFFIVPETHFNRHPLHFQTIKKNLHEVLTHRTFMGIVILMGLAYSLIISFNTSAPFLIQTEMGYSPVFFGHLALGLGLVFLASTFACRHFLKTHSVEKLYFIAVNLFFSVAVIGVIASYFLTQSIALVAIISALMYFACGFVFPMSMGKGLASFRHVAGTATAMMFFINMLITSLMGFLVSFIPIHSTIPLMWIYAGLLSMATVAYWSMIRKCG
ncbi:MAG TPA: Bcr/CflA family efflux MFS transporter [Gammaproteobacteria bacterium]|nr:Bcr/CflA family efflux MFS transporter [Gammaproteobacteria bacterium]